MNLVESLDGAKETRELASFAFHAEFLQLRHAKVTLLAATSGPARRTCSDSSVAAKTKPIMRIKAGISPVCILQAIDLPVRLGSAVSMLGLTRLPV